MMNSTETIIQENDGREMLSIYDEIMKTPNWCASGIWKSKDTVDSLFRGDAKRGKVFVKDYLRLFDKEQILTFTKNNQIDEFNAAHTLSVFFLGIFMQDKMKIAMDELPTVYKSDTGKNFYYFWMLICMCHDTAKALEDDADAAKEIFDIRDFRSKYRIGQCFAAQSRDHALFKRYFQYRLTGRNTRKIDHGIAGACILYGVMMKKWNHARKAGAVTPDGGYNYGGLHFSKGFSKNMLLAANTIAHHNLWRADGLSLKEKDVQTVKKFKEYGLDALIIDDDHKRKISLSSEQDYTRATNELDQRLLFLLALTDSIEPIKAAEKGIKDGQELDYLDVLKKVKIFADPNKIEIKVDNECYYAGYQKRLEDLEQFMDVHLTTEDTEKKIVIEMV